MTDVESIGETPDSQQCELKNNSNSKKKIEKAKKVSTQRLILKSLDRIGICLNDKPTSDMSTFNLDKVCFILINNYKYEDNELGVGPLNDGYLVGLKHHRHDFKVFYLYNPRSEEFSSYLCFFLKYTSSALTVFYSGRGSNKEEGIEFRDETIPKSSINKYILQECQGEKQVMFITDCLDGGSVFDIHGENNECNLISFSVTRSIDFGENKRPRGIFTYYFCKLTSDFPNITPNRLLDRMNPSLNRFNEVFSCEASRKELFNSPIFF